MNFAVIPFNDPGPEFQEIIDRIDPGAYVAYAPKVYFVRFTGTAASLASAVGFTGESRAMPGVVVASQDYFGYGNTDLWGWLSQ